MEDLTSGKQANKQDKTEKSIELSCLLTPGEFQWINTNEDW